MTNEELGQLLLAMALLLLAANLLGQLFGRLHQPKVVGEILAGVLLGPSILGAIAPGFSSSIFGAGPTDPRTVGLSFVYNLGLLLLMFVSGAAVRNVLGKENRKQTAWLLTIGTPLPFFIVFFLAPVLPLDSLIGDAGSRTAVVLILCTAVAVTSIPVITKIFSDLGILHTRFASLMLGSAVLEDIMLWGVLSIATSIASASMASGGGDVTATVTGHVLVNAAYVALAMTVMPRVLRYLGRARWNLIATNTPVAWMMLVFLVYVAVAGALDVTPVFAAFLAGFGVMGGIQGTERPRFLPSMESIAAVSAALFIPLYFALVGFRLDFGEGFSLPLLVAFLVGSSVVSILCGLLASRLAGFRGVALFNLAITANARGGPGIVLASVAFDAGIISSAFFTALVVAAVLTSQMCGVWLGYVVRKGWSLLGETPEEELEWAREPHEVAAA